MFESLKRTLFGHRAQGEPIVVVSGLPRSGTSMMMAMIEAAGLPVMTDQQREADIDNPKGYFEYERIKDLEKETDKSYVREGRGKVLKVISFLIKDLPDDNDYRVIFMRRDLGEVLGKFIEPFLTLRYATISWPWSHGRVAMSQLSWNTCSTWGLRLSRRCFTREQAAGEST